MFFVQRHIDIMIAQRRIKNIENGKSKTISLKDVMKEYDFSTD